MDLSTTAGRFLDNSTGFVFQQFLIDCYESAVQLENSSFLQSPKVTTVIRAFGRINEKLSVCCHIHGYYPFIYALLPPQLTPSQCIFLTKQLNDYISASGQPEVINESAPVIEIVVTEADIKKRLLGKVIIAKPAFVSTVKAHLDSWTFNLPGCFDYSPTVIDYTSSYIQMFRKERNVTAFCWMDIGPQTYQIRSKKLSTCIVEVDVDCSDIVTHSPQGKWALIIPLTILSFDIECECQKGRFVKPDEDAVIQISSAVIRYGEAVPTMKTVFTLNTCAPITDAAVFSYETEVELISAWTKFLTQVDPDVIMGYNIVNFDIWYLIERSKKIQSDQPLNIGRISNSMTTWYKADYKSSRVDWRQNKFCNVEGRVILDVMLRIIVEQSLDCYTLNYVSNVYLDRKKEDVKYEMIMDLQNGDEFSRKKLAQYCLTDTLLPINILVHLDLLAKYIAVGVRENMQMCDVVGSGNRQLFSSCHLLPQLSIYKYSDHEQLKILPANQTQEAEGKSTASKVVEKRVKPLGMRRMLKRKANFEIDQNNAPIPLKNDSKNSVETKTLPILIRESLTKSAEKQEKQRCRRFGLSRRIKRNEHL